MMTEANGEAYDPYRLQRFVDAQASCFAQVRSELLAGQKQSHWMWFVFPIRLSHHCVSPMEILYRAGHAERLLSA